LTTIDRQADSVLVSVSDAARALSVSEATIRRRIAAGALAALRIGEGGAVRVPVSALEELCVPYCDDAKEEEQS
jgi:excisionase family DNA binding protein